MEPFKNPPLEWTYKGPYLVKFSNVAAIGGLPTSASFDMSTEILTVDDGSIRDIIIEFIFSIGDVKSYQFGKSSVLWIKDGMGRLLWKSLKRR